MRDGTAEPISRNEIDSQARTGIKIIYGDRVKIIFPVQLTTSRIGNHVRLI